MKKIFLIIILLLFSVLSCHANNTIIEDELLKPEMYDGSTFKLGIFKKGEYHIVPITDELIDEDFIEQNKNFKISKKDIPDDFFIEKHIDLSKHRKIKPKTKYDFTKEIVPIQIKIVNHLKSTKTIREGSTIPFKAINDFEINGKKYKKGTNILGRVETISESDKMGVPEFLKIDNFYIEGEEDINLYGSISKIGANRSIWVYPLYQAGNILLYAAGFAFVPIHGGRAKLLTTETFTIFYETQ